MSELVARTGRSQQRYKDGCRLVAGYLSIYLSIHSSSFFSPFLIKLPISTFVHKMYTIMAGVFLSSIVTEMEHQTMMWRY